MILPFFFFFFNRLNYFVLSSYNIELNLIHMIIHIFCNILAIDTHSGVVLLCSDLYGLCLIEMGWNAVPSMCVIWFNRWFNGQMCVICLNR